MNYHLLTGATGLLGSYLLRELLLRDQPVAVLVRPSRFESAPQRIDNVLTHWEEQWQRWLPRPVVLPGDINQPGLGLDSSQRFWVSQNCRSVLHSAASLSFQQEGEEPWRTNVDGLKNLLSFCSEHALREFSHISSCYVCGLREGLILETEHDVGQKCGNIYEESKLAGEQLVRNASHLDSYTVFRPAIIVGDTDTGFSSTFHGFYTPLRLLSALATHVPHDDLFSMNHMQYLGLQGHEGKNCVPVQWVSDAIVSLMERRPNCEQTYALAAERPVSTDQLIRVFEKAIRESQPSTQAQLNAAAQIGLDSPEIQATINSYTESFAVYQSYWRDDPRFDMTNTKKVIPDKRLPPLSDADLLKLCQYALDNQFSWKPTRQPADAVLARDRLGMMLERSSASVDDASTDSTKQGEVSDLDSESSLSMIISGPGGGAWTMFEDGAEVSYVEGKLSKATQVRLNCTTFRALTEGELSVKDAINQGRILLTGHPSAVELFRRSLDCLAIR